MNEDYVSLEVAKLLKIKGFDWPCQAFYSNGDALVASPIHTINDEMLCSDIACPTLYMAEKWLREVHEIHIAVNPDKFGWSFMCYELRNNFCPIGAYSYHSTYDKALNAGIVEALKYI